MYDIALKSNDMDFEAGDFVPENDIDQVIANIITVWLQTYITSYALDSTVGVDILQMERILDSRTMVMFLNDALSYFFQNQIILGLSIASFSVIKGQINMDLRITTNLRDISTQILIGD